MNGVWRPPFDLAVIGAFVADIGDVQTCVYMAGGKVAGGGESWHLEASIERRVAVDFNVRRSFTYDEQFVAEWRDAPDRPTLRQCVEQCQAGMFAFTVTHIPSTAL